MRIENIQIARICQNCNGAKTLAPGGNQIDIQYYPCPHCNGVGERSETVTLDLPDQVLKAFIQDEIADALRSVVAGFRGTLE